MEIMRLSQIEPCLATLMFGDITSSKAVVSVINKVLVLVSCHIYIQILTHIYIYMDGYHCFKNNNIPKTVRGQVYLILVTGL